jgi:hypothetical protein
MIEQLNHDKLPELFVDALGWLARKQRTQADWQPPQ